MDWRRRSYEEFALLAISFCRIVESEQVQNTRQLRQSLTRLYLAALALPPVAVDDLDVPNLVSSTEQQALRLLLSKRLAIDFYWVVFQPLTERPEQPVAGSLADDLTDIWHDLSEGLRALEADCARYERSVWWEWRYGFETHWGVHAVDALYTLHRVSSAL